MGDLEYAVADLRALGKRLHSLRDGLASDGPLCHVDKYDVNSRHVIDALNEFANDWDDKREGLARQEEQTDEIRRALKRLVEWVRPDPQPVQLRQTK